LADDRRGGAGGLAAAGEVDGHLAPADDALALGGRRALEQRLELVAAVGLVGEEAHRDPVAPAGRKLAPEL